MKPILCETCLNGEKEIKDEVYGYYNKKIKTLYFFCSKKGRYVTHSDKYECPDYANKRLTDYMKKEVVKK